MTSDYINVSTNQPVMLIQNVHALQQYIKVKTNTDCEVLYYPRTLDKDCVIYHGCLQNVLFLK